MYAIWEHFSAAERQAVADAFHDPAAPPRLLGTVADDRRAGKVMGDTPACPLGYALIVLRDVAGLAPNPTAADVALALTPDSPALPRIVRAALAFILAWDSDLLAGATLAAALGVEDPHA